MKKNIGIIGTGSLGTALTYLLSQNKNKIYLYEKNPQIFSQILKHPKIKKQKNIFPTSSLEEIIQTCEYLIPCLPSSVIDFFYNDLKPTYNNQKIISVSKGFYLNTTRTISQTITSWLPLKNFIVFSGPTFAEEIIQQNPTSAILASNNPNISKELFSIFNNNFFTPQIIHNKTIENEYTGILKNCYAISLGIISKANFGMNTKCLCIDKIFTECKTFYQNNQLDSNQLYNISFLGDLIATGFNQNSRNYQFGQKLKHNKKITVEGELNLKPLLQIAKKTNTSLPILEITNKIINQPQNFSQHIRQLQKILLAPSISMTAHTNK